MEIKKVDPQYLQWPDGCIVRLTGRIHARGATYQAIYIHQAFCSFSLANCTLDYVFKPGAKIITRVQFYKAACKTLLKLLTATIRGHAASDDSVIEVMKNK